MPVTPVQHTVPTPDGPMPALLWHPDPAVPRPGLVVLQEIFGLSDYVVERCAALADLGYAVLAPEIYWRLGGDVVRDDDPGFLDRAMGLVQQLDWDAAVRDGVAAVEHLDNTPGVTEVGLVGFCFGGGLAFNVAAELEGTSSEPSGLVSYYGSALPQLIDLAPDVTCPSLHHFGSQDAYIPMDQVERIRAAVTDGGARDDVELHLYDGAGHAFDNPHPMFHHAPASEEAWDRTERWLLRHLPVPG
jgi:carboxymethylenebutenolidase